MFHVLGAENHDMDFGKAFVHHLCDTKKVPALYFLYMVLDATYFLGLELSICVFEHNSGPSVLFKVICFVGTCLEYVTYQNL